MTAIRQQNLFHTPKDWDELQDWIERHAPAERVHLYTAAGMAWNLAAKITNRNKEDSGDDE